MITALPRRPLEVCLFSAMFAAVALSAPSLRGQWSQLGTGVGGSVAGDRAGSSVAMSADGSRLVFGAPSLFSTFVGSGGYARVFDWDPSTSAWQQIGTDLTAENPGDSAGFAVAMAADGTRVAVGAPYNQGGAFENGHVRVFEWSEVNVDWLQIGADIDFGSSSARARSGWSVSLSSNGHRVAIGAPGSGAPFRNGAGSARVLEWDPAANLWLPVGADIEGRNIRDASGTCVALSADGHRLAVSEPWSASRIGQVKVYDWNPNANSWQQAGRSISGEAASDEFGRAIALSADGRRLAIGAPYNDGAALNAGHVKIFEWHAPSQAWIPVGADIDGVREIEESGSSVALTADGNRVAIGARWGRDGLGSLPGVVRVFDWDPTANTWVQAGADVIGEQGLSNFGDSIAMSNDGHRIAVGAPRENSILTGDGQVRVLRDVCLVAESRSYGAGSSPSGAAPRLSTVGIPRLGQRVRIELDNPSATSGRGALLFGFGRANLPFANGAVLVSSALYFAAFVQPAPIPSGVSTLFDVTLANDPALCFEGLTLNFQAFIFEPGGATPTGFALSSGEEWAIGR